MCEVLGSCDAPLPVKHIPCPVLHASIKKYP